MEFSLLMVVVPISGTWIETFVQSCLLRKEPKLGSFSVTTYPIQGLINPAGIKEAHQFLIVVDTERLIKEWTKLFSLQLISHWIII